MWSSMLERWRARSVLVRETDLWCGETSWPSFEDWCARNRGRRCVLSASAAHLHELMVDPALALRDDRQVIAWARAQWMQYHGEEAAQWSVAAWEQGTRRGVSALHGFSLPAVLATARRHRVRVASLRPWWPSALGTAIAGEPGLARLATRLVVFEGAHLTRLDLLRGELESIQSDRLDTPTLEELARTCGDELDRPTWVVGYGLSDLAAQARPLRLP